MRMSLNSRTTGLLAIIFLLLFTGLVSLNLFFQQRRAKDRLDIKAFPYIVGEWKGKDLKVTEKEYEILETRNLIVREYSRPQGERLSLFIIYSETNRAVFHPPEVCLIGSGVKITDKSTEEINYGKNSFVTNKLYAEKAENKELILYCYKAGNLYTENFYLQQAYFAFNQLLGRHIRGATIRVSMPIKTKGNEQKALTHLKHFIAASAQLIDTLRITSTL